MNSFAKIIGCLTLLATTVGCASTSTVIRVEPFGNHYTPQPRSAVLKRTPAQVMVLKTVEQVAREYHLVLETNQQSAYDPWLRSYSVLEGIRRGPQLNVTTTGAPSGSVITIIASTSNENVLRRNIADALIVKLHGQFKPEQVRISEDILKNPF